MRKMQKSKNESHLDITQPILAPVTPEILVLSKIKTSTKTLSVKIEKVYRLTDIDKDISGIKTKQILVLIQALTEIVQGTISEWTQKALELGLETRQEPTKITKYYLPILINSKIVEEIK